MKKRFLIQVIKNETGEIVQSYPYDKQLSAQQNFDGLKLTGIYGATEEYEQNLLLVDDSDKAVKEDEIEDRTKARQFCALVIDRIAAYNKAHATPSQMQATFSNPATLGITVALLSGATETARNLIALVGPQLYPASLVTEIVTAMDEFIESEKPPVEEPQDESEDPPQDETGGEGNETEGESNDEAP